MARAVISLPAPSQLTSRIIAWSGNPLGALGTLGGGNLISLSLPTLDFCQFYTTLGDLLPAWETGARSITLQASGVATDLVLPGPDNAGNTRRDSSANYRWFYGSGSRAALNSWLSAVRAATNPTYTLILDDGAAPPDLMPGFGAAAVADQAYTAGTEIPVLQLPEADSGDPPLSYTVTPALPAGLRFDSATRRITGTPTAASPSAVYTYTAEDVDGDTADLQFRIAVAAAPPGAPVPAPDPADPRAPLAAGADLGLDRKWEEANITRTAADWRRRVEAMIDALLGDGNPFGTAALVDTGTAAGEAVRLDVDGRIPAALFAALPAPEGFRDFQIANVPLGEGEFTEDMDLHSEDRDGVLFIELSYTRVSAGEDPAVPVQVPDAAPTVSGLDQAVEVKIGETFEDTVTLSDPAAELSAVLQAETVCRIEVQGEGADRRLLYTPVTVGSTAGTVTASKGSADRNYPVGVTVRPEAGTPLVGPEAAGLRREVEIQAGETLLDDFRVTPADAVVSLQVPPDEAVAQGVLSGNAFDGTGNRRVAWAGVRAGIADGVIRVANRADQNVNAEYPVQITVLAVAPGPAPDPPDQPAALRITGLRPSVEGYPGDYLADDFSVTRGAAVVTAESDDETVVSSRVIGSGTDRRLLHQLHRTGSAVVTVTADHDGERTTGGTAVEVTDPSTDGGPVL